MLEALDAIPVKFGPHEGDVWMIAATLLSFATSLTVAVVAARNGRRAIEIAERSAGIAKEAARRDTNHKKLESRLRAQHQRDEVGLAMMRALTALNVYVNRCFNDGNEEIIRARRVLDDLSFEAISLIDLFPISPELEGELRGWFELNVSEVVRAAQKQTKPFEELVGRVESFKIGVRDWTKYRKPLQELPGFFEGDSL